MSQSSDILHQTIISNVHSALKEDIASGDISAELIDPTADATAVVISREPAIVSGQAWVNEVFHQIDPSINIDWHLQNGDRVQADQTIFTAHGKAKNLLTAERTALNFLQTLSATATVTRQYVDQLKDTNTRLLDTRKTIPNLRLAQKQAVLDGGGHNHRIGLFDAFLIKENHIMACGSITQAIQTAYKLHPDKLIEVEVETLEELQEALNTKTNVIMLDNFNLEQMAQAVQLRDQQAADIKLEASGEVNLRTIRGIAQTGVDYISVGGLTKHVQAINLSMRFG